MHTFACPMISIQSREWCWISWATDCATVIEHRWKVCSTAYTEQPQIVPCNDAMCVPLTLRSSTSLHIASTSVFFMAMPSEKCRPERVRNKWEMLWANFKP